MEKRLWGGQEAQVPESFSPVSFFILNKKEREKALGRPNAIADSRLTGLGEPGVGASLFSFSQTKEKREGVANGWSQASSLTFSFDFKFKM